ncbi:Phytochrome, two-component sensor histidine kinase [Nitrincola lacisaponensis]|uniref:histidine kinase n=1 Tax=Nitrincola lacisaponensis TaxID=267850 RepID=A0A063Y6U3_9GAMM|nr:sensor histidine kinase [Nitrincola lacisaponensis]KDE40157.1 Phytochrome, two-component sensor histidine kinase [Nitrincola lacisaponensis]
MSGTLPALPRTTAVNLALVLLGMLILLSLYLLHRSSTQDYQQQRLLQVEQSVRSLSLTQRELVNARLHEVDRSLLTLRRLSEHSGAKGDELREYMLSRQLSSPELLDYFWLDRQGEMRVRTFDQPAPVVADRDYFRVHQHRTIDQPYLSSPAWSRMHDPHLFIALSRPVFNSDGVFDGVLVAAIDVNVLAEELGQITEQADLTTALLTLEGELIYRMPKINLQPGLMVAQVMQWQGEPPDNYTYRGAAPVDGKWRQTAYQRLDDWGLLVVVTQDLEAVLQDIERFYQRESYKFALMALFAVLALVFCGWMVQRQRRLDQYMNAQLRESHERLMEAQQQAHLGHWEADLSQGTLWWSDVIFDIYGQDSQSCQPTLDSFVQAIHPDDRDAVLSLSVAPGPQGVVDVQHRIVHSDGAVRWVHQRVREVVDEQGRRLLGSTQDITEQKLHEEAIRRQAEALQASNDELEQFAYVVSHDLRQPLRMIISFSKALEPPLSQLQDASVHEYLGYIHEGGQRLDEMLVSLLEYSRVGRGGEPVSACSVAQLRDEALIYLGPEIRSSGAEIEIDGEWPVLPVSRNEGVRLFQNLIGNALKFHAPEAVPRIRLTGECRSDLWLCRITDQGIGIDPAQLERIFKVFQRLNPRSAYRGEGIGLAVCRKIVQRHGGEIHAESRGSGQGACIHFTLPLMTSEESSGA